MTTTTRSPRADSCTYLTEAQQAHFLEQGYVKISNAVKPDYLRSFTENVWVRLGYDPNDSSTWEKEKIHMPRHREIPTSEFMPDAWKAICDLLGGEEHIDKTLFESCGDSLIVNLGTEYWETHDIHPRDLGNWHIDGDWFTHYLNSGEQALVVIVLFNDVNERGAPTYLAPDGIKRVCQYLYEHPEGADQFNTEPDGSRAVCSIKQSQTFVPLTGKAGDVYIAHPFMPHSASKNHSRVPRFITNPPVTLKHPFRLYRPDNDYTLVERVTLRALDAESTGLPDWKITGRRRRFPPRTRAGKDAMIQDEVARMKVHAKKTGGFVDSMHINGVVPYQVVVASG